MEALPVEITDKILDLIFEANPQDLYGLRCISKSWKDMVDRCTARLLKVWCKKCSDEFPENFLDDFVQSKLPQSWQEYCSNEIAVPHIARDIYKFSNEFPNLVGNPQFTAFYTTPNEKRERICGYAVNDKYFAINLIITEESSEKKKYVLRIYSQDDLVHHIREYHEISYTTMNFYATDNQIFLLFGKHHFYEPDKYAFLVEFLVNGDLIPTNLPSSSGRVTHVITKNECFTYKKNSNRVQHHQMTPNGFECSTVVKVSIPDDMKHTTIRTVQICDSYLLVFIYSECEKYYKLMTVYKHEIFRQRSGKVVFSDSVPYLTMKFSSVPDLYFGADHIPLPNSIGDLDSCEFKRWIMGYFHCYSIISLTIYAYCVVMKCREKMIIFRGNYRQFMDYAVRDADLGSKCTVIEAKSNAISDELLFGCDHVIHVESKPQFLFITPHKALIMKFAV